MGITITDVLPVTASGFEHSRLLCLRPENAKALAVLLSCPVDRARLFPESSVVPTACDAARRWCRPGDAPSLDLLSFVPGVASPIAAMRLRGGDLAYVVAASHRGRGVATRVLTALIAALGGGSGTRVSANVQRENNESRKLLERAGFTFRGLTPTKGKTPAMLSYDLEV